MKTTRYAMRLFYAALALCSIVVSGAVHMDMGGTPEDFLNELEAAGDISTAEHQAITEQFLRKNELVYNGHHAMIESPFLERELRDYLAEKTEFGKITSKTADYIASLLADLSLDKSASRAEGANPATRAYTGNGNVIKLGPNVDPDPANMEAMDNYNGIWGYIAGVREYALQCNHNGLHIIDFTDPANAYRVQFIPMPGGNIWRDVETQYHSTSGKTFAYVAAQSDGNLWVVDLSYLSIGTLGNGQDSDPIPISGYADLGRTNYGHTLSVHDGLLFLNSAGLDSLGCQIFDLNADPFNPPLINDYSGTQRDCHDSFVRSDVPGFGNLLFSSDGHSGQHRIIDINNVRGEAVTVIGETPVAQGTYAHSSDLTDNSKYLYTFDETNQVDISVYDVSDPTSPTLVTSFQYSDDSTENSIVHNGKIVGNYLVVAYYEAGLRVFDISNPANAVEVGKYETWRDPDGDGVFNELVEGEFQGAWNVYIFPSRKVLVSDMKHGTFLFQVNGVPLPGEPGSLTATLSSPDQVNLVWTVSEGSTGYAVYRSTTSEAVDKTIVATNVVGAAFNDVGLAHSTTYYYVVTATNAEGESRVSNEVSVTTPGPCGNGICEIGKDCSTCAIDCGCGADCPAFTNRTECLSKAECQWKRLRRTCLTKNRRLGSS